MDADHGDSCEGQECFSRLIVDGPAPSAPVRLGSDPDRLSSVQRVDLTSGLATLDAAGNPRGEVRYDGQTNDIDIELWSFGVGAEHQFDRAKLEAQLNVSQASKTDFEVDGDFKREGFAFEYDAPTFFRAVDEDFRVINGDFSYLPDVDPFALVVDETRADTIQPDFFQTEFNDVVEDRLSFKLDYERDLPAMDFVTGSWKAGVKYASMEKVFDYTEVQYEFAEPGDAGYSLVPWADLIHENPYGPVDAQPMPFTPDMAAQLSFVNDPANAGNGSFEIDGPGSLEDSIEQDYSYEEDIYAAYGMVTFQAGPLEVIGGLRWELTDMTVDRNEINDRSGDFTEDDFSPASDDRDYRNLLPALHLKWAVTDNLLLRFASTKTFARPQILDLVSVRVVEEEDDPVEIDTGNFDLPALESQNLDLVLEYYTEEGLWSAGLFRKDLENFSFPATTIIDNVEEFGGRQVQIKSPQAANTARNQGLELSVFQRLGFLPAPFDGLFVNANYTYTDSDATYPNREDDDLPTRGASEHLAFASLGYEWRGLSAEVQYRRRSPYIEGLAFVDAQGANDFTEDDVFGETETWNANLSYQVLDQVTVFVNGTNLFNEQNASRQGFANTPEDVYFNERRIAFGIEGSL
ncbi:MAG: TonB-dependent receptor [Gammaproteobacteria bacterium]|nr:TonB-dependent receptor [Gammaproteobacteria bacterium]